MKIKKNTDHNLQLKPDSQNRLIAYTTAAGLGAFFAGQCVEAQVVESSAFSYPANLNVGSGSAGYNYINIDGAGNNFNLDIATTRATLGGIMAGDNALNPSANGYIIPWTVGMTIDAGTGSAPTYKKWLANGGSYAFNNFPDTEAMGFKFVSGGSTYFGYMNIQIVGGGNDITAATVTGIYYNEAADAPITIGAVPEPSSLALLAVGFAGMSARRVQRERRNTSNRLAHRI